MLRLCRGVAQSLRSVENVAPALTRAYASSTFRVADSKEMTVTGRSGRYALKLYEAAAKSNAVAAVEKDLDLLSKDLPDDKFLSYVSIKATEKLQALENDVFKPNKTNDLSKQLIEALLERRELKMLPKIAADFGKIASFERNELLVTVTTAGPLDAKNEDTIKKQLADKIPAGKKLSIKSVIEPSIIGGYIAECNNMVLDNSVKTKIQQVQNIIGSPEFAPVVREAFQL